MTRLDDSKRKKIEECISKARNGKTEEYGTVYDLLIDHIYQFIFWKVKSSHEAEDLTEDVFKKAWLNLHEYKAKNFCGYIFTIARNTVIDHYRKTKEKVSLEGVTLVDETDGPFDRYIKGERKEIVHEALSRLPKLYRQVVVLRFMQDLDVSEVASIIGKSQISVRVIQFRALRKLKNILKQI